MSNNLFSDFDEVSAKQWKQKIQYDLKGADYNKNLVWNSNDGVAVNPFYHPDDSPEPVSVKAPSGWNICEKIFVASAEKSNKKALEALEKGAESLWFNISSEEIEPEMLFLDIPLGTTPIYISFEFLSEAYFSKLKKFFSGKEHQVSLQIDIVGNLARSGNWFKSLKEDFSLLNEIVSETEVFPTAVSVNMGLYENAGANIPQQLAYALAHATEYLQDFEKQKDFSAARKKAFKMTFLTAVGSNYFFEIAKLRALRLLFSTVAEEFGVSEKCFILAQPSKRNKTIYDYNVNLLRTTTECMSAALGGADAICNLPYDSVFHKENDFARRIARNQLLILKNESYFEKAANPAEGAYYIETLTQQFAERALEIFKGIENAGGFLTQLKEGTIQKKITESAKKQQEQFKEGELVLVGTNKYANHEDKMKDELQLFPFLKKHPRKTLIQPILERRIAEKHEQERLEKEQEKGQS
ncbi:methylmalonyl-CoA mutase subunit beta [Salinimicrobium sp. GXAS 041]|uniref:methylmalonyl-CoA mutase subunit beta n=1 Tax=Salinimicrobium sp. GXAS 041 TaxID=3400806 RepID=UPI003C735038